MGGGERVFGKFHQTIPFTSLGTLYSLARMRSSRHVDHLRNLRDGALDETAGAALEGKTHEPHWLAGREVGLGVLLRSRLVHRGRRRFVHLQLEDVSAARMVE